MKTEKIKEIKIIDVMDRLWVEYRSTGAWEYSIVENGDITSGWRFNVNKNIVHDFSKDRPSGDTFWFVKMYLNISDDKDVFHWFDENFHTGTDQKKPVSLIWSWLETLQDKHKEYLKSRGIEYEKVKDFVKLYNNGIACLVYEWEIPRGINARTLSTDHNRRFTALSGYSTKWVYKYKLDTNKDYVIVVEGLMDFLSIRQDETNVIGLKSAESGIEDIIKLSEKYKIYYVSDNDEAGKKSLEKLKGIKYKWFDISQFDAKDVNELLINGWGAFDLSELIIQYSEYVAPISSTIKKFEKLQQIIMTQGKLWFDWPFEELYDLCSWVIPWKVYTIGAYSNTGKSKLAYHHIWYFLEQWKSVAMISLEVDEGMCFGNIASNRDWIHWSELIKWKKPIYDNYKDLIIRDDLFDLNKIVDFIKWCNCDIVFIDFVQNIHAKGSAYERNALIAQTIQRTAIETNTTIYSISQVSNATGRDLKKDMDTLPTLKWAGEYYASSDVIMMMNRVDNKIILHLVKNKYWPVGNKRELWVERGFNRFTLKKEIKDGTTF